MVYYKEELHTPSWMDDLFFEKVLRKSESDPNLSVSACTISPGSKAGDHVMSAVLRAVVQYQSQGKQCETSLIVKSLCDGHLRSNVEPLFETETIMYETVVPEMERLLRTVGADTEFGPRLLHSSKEPTLVMVFEDLTSRDYTMKYRQLDLHEAKIVFTKLARWHAASVFLADTLPAIKTPNMGLQNMAQYANIKWAANIALVAKLCRSWPGYGVYAERLEKFVLTFAEKVRQTYSSHESNLFNVLNHGDFHYKNMMFKSLDGCTTDILLLDYQISVWGTPAIDLIYALYTAFSVETRDNHRDELVKFYHDEFVSVLTKLGYLKKIPTLVDLHVELIKCGHLEPFWTCCLLPHMMISLSDLAEIQKDIQGGVDMTDVDKLKKIKLAMFQHPKYTSMIKRYLPMFLHKGQLD